VLGRQALHRRDDETAGGLGLDPPAADDVQLDAATGEAAEVVERASQIPGEPVEVIDDDGARTGGADALGQALEAVAPAAAHAVVDEHLHELPPALGAVGRDALALVFQGDGALARLLRATDVADSDHAWITRRLPGRTAKPLNALFHVEQGRFDRGTAGPLGRQPSRPPSQRSGECGARRGPWYAAPAHHLVSLNRFGVMGHGPGRLPPTRGYSLSVPILTPKHRSVSTLFSLPRSTRSPYDCRQWPRKS
jgi:hypothetical protein